MIIVLFHVIYLLGKFVYRRYSGRDDEDVMGQEDEDVVQSKAMKELTNLKRRFSGDLVEEGPQVDVKFSPPVYIQRYQAVTDILSDPRYAGKLKKVVDFGCSELSYCIYLKNMLGVEEALFVDIDSTTLNMYKEKARPFHADYLHRRKSPLVFRVLEGSVAQPDKLLENTDAVVCIELVEHLYPEPLTNLPFNIFGFIKPKVAIITTPNADFNILFKNMTGFRHPDHKFEWTRKQFQDWANNILSRFPEYEVTFHGIGNGPPGTEDLGACSQMAVFNKINDLETEKVPSFEGLYNTVAVYEYPYEVDNRSDEQKILDDAVYYIRKFSGNDEELSEEIPLQLLSDLMKRSHFISLYNLKEILENANWTVVDRENGPVVLVPPPSTFSDHSLIEEDFLDHDYPPGNYDWDEEPPGPPADYFYHHLPNDDINFVEENWEDEPHIIVPPIECRNQNTENASINTEVANSTPSIYPDDICWDDLETENRSTELANSTIDNSITISSFSETKESDNSDNVRESCQQEQSSSISTYQKIADATSSFFSCQSQNQTKLDDSEMNATNISSDKSTSICSMFLEPSRMSYDVHLEDTIDQCSEYSTDQYSEYTTDQCSKSTDQYSEYTTDQCSKSTDQYSEYTTDQCSKSTITSPGIDKPNKKLKLTNSIVMNSINDNTFEEPIYTSSPHNLSNICKKRKVEQKIFDSNPISSNGSSEKLMLGTNDETENKFKNNSEFDNPSSCSNNSVTAESISSSEYSPETNSFESLEKDRHYTGMVPKNFNGKISGPKLKTLELKETKFEKMCPDTPESPPDSWSPEIMDSGYPNSNSPPDLSPEYDLSSIAHDTSDSESPSIADAPRFDFDLVQPENRDLANNNLDGEGNNMEQAEENINDLQPLINVLENDLENENDIYVEPNGFPIWLLRILQRFDADGVRINLPIRVPPNENFGE